MASSPVSPAALSAASAAAVRPPWGCRSLRAGSEDHRRLHFPCSGRRLELEERVGHVSREVPLPDRHLVLRHSVFGLVGDHELPRQRLRARVDPELPVDRLLLERQVVASDAAHVVDAEIDAALDAPHQPVVDVGVEKVRERDHHPRPIQGRVHGPVERRGRLHPHVDVLRVVENRERLAVVPDAAVDGVTGRGAGRAVRTPERHVAAAGELDAREVLRHFVVDLLGLERERLRRREKVAHLPDELDHPRLDETRGCRGRRHGRRGGSSAKRPGPAAGRRRV